MKQVRNEISKLVDLLYACCCGCSRLSTSLRGRTAMLGWGHRNTKARSGCGCSANTLSVPRWERSLGLERKGWGWGEWGHGWSWKDGEEMGSGGHKGNTRGKCAAGTEKSHPPCPFQRKWSHRVVTPKQHILLSENCDVEALVIILFFSLEMRKLKQWNIQSIAQTHTVTKGQRQNLRYSSLLHCSWLPCETVGGQEESRRPRQGV